MTAWYQKRSKPQHNTEKVKVTAWHKTGQGHSMVPCLPLSISLASSWLYCSCLSFIICVALYTLAILYRSRSQHGTLPTFVHLLGQQLVILLLFELYHLCGTVHLGYTVQVKVTAWYPAYLCPSPWPAAGYTAPV